jgi:hypothetical protein
MAVPMEILGKHIASTENIVHNTESHATNYSPNFPSDWANVAPSVLLLTRTAALSEHPIDF